MNSVALSTKADLVASSRGDELIETLFARHYDRMLRFAYVLTGGRGHEDLVQEGFIRALRRWDRDAAPETFGPWVQTTIVRLHLSALRSARRERAAFRRLGPPDVVEDEAPSVDVMRALAELPPRQRAAVVLRYLEDLPEREVADRLGVRLGTAKALLHQARQRLQVEPKIGV